MKILGTRRTCMKVRNTKYDREDSGGLVCDPAYKSFQRSTVRICGHTLDSFDGATDGFDVRSMYFVLRSCEGHMDTILDVVYVFALSTT